jgi:hypothetical protein
VDLALLLFTAACLVGWALAMYFLTRGIRL